MTLNEIYQLKPISVSNRLELVFDALTGYANRGDSYLHLKIRNSFGENEYIGELDGIFNIEKIECKFYMDDSDINDKYGARLYSIFYNKEPLMLVKNNGRYFSDYETFISNESGVKELVDELIFCKSQMKNEEPTNIYSADENIEGLEAVGSYNLFDHYDENLNINYKVGDVVWAWIIENHLNYQDNYVLTKVKINKVNEFRKNKTYHGQQINRTWEHKGNISKMIYIPKTTDSKDNFGIGCSLEEYRIIGLVNNMPIPELAIDNLVDTNGFLPKEYNVSHEQCIKMINS